MVIALVETSSKEGTSFVKMDGLLNNNIFAVHAAAAAASVTLGTVLTYPLDTLKVLIQV